MPTAAILETQAAIILRWPLTRMEVDACRKISGSSSWSQHSWGNAVDIYPSNKFQGDRIYNFLVSARDSGRLKISTICWYNQGGCTTPHTDHIHVDGAPKKTGTPPCAGGPATEDREANVQGVIGEYGVAGTITSGVGGVAGSIAEWFMPFAGEGIPELGLDASANAAERLVTFLVGFGLIIVGLALIATELRGTIIGNTIGKVANAA